jgi:glycosyltransferase involved in cell wall biosynthesis
MTSAASGKQLISAYVPCYNNARTVALAIEGLKNQTHPVDELFVVDDGSTDESAAVAEGLGVQVIRLGKNEGRGAARARAMETARHEFVVCCDATNRLSPDFVELALKWFSGEDVLAAFGHWHDPHPRNAIDRWRARHLFRAGSVQEVRTHAFLATYGAVLRKSAVMQAGNYDRRLRHGEDFDLGLRLLKLGNVIMDPALKVEPVVHNTMFEVMERFARWNRASIEAYTLESFVNNHVLAWRILIPRDLENHDVAAALISATLPYFSVAYADKKSFSLSSKSKILKPS